MTQLARAYFGHQCFWGESAWAKINGVVNTRVGYAGGKTPNPTYKAIADHTEIIEVTFEPETVNYQSLLDYFFAHHNPVMHRKKQYQSAVLYVDDSQKELTLKTIESVKAKLGNIETYVELLDKFYQAEDYHQKYWLRSKTDIFNELHLTDAQVADSRLATKLNAYAAGYTDFTELEALTAEHKLQESLVAKIEQFAKAGGDPRVCH